MGEALIKQLVNYTELPPEMVEQEFNRLIEKAGLKREEMTLDDVRDLLADFLQDTLIEMKNSYQD